MWINRRLWRVLGAVLLGVLLLTALLLGSSHFSSVGTLRAGYDGAPSACKACKPVLQTDDVIRTYEVILDVDERKGHVIIGGIEYYEDTFSMEVAQHARQLLEGCTNADDSPRFNVEIIDQYTNYADAESHINNQHPDLAVALAFDAWTPDGQSSGSPSCGQVSGPRAYIPDDAPPAWADFSQRVVDQIGERTGLHSSQDIWFEPSLYPVEGVDRSIPGATHIEMAYLSNYCPDAPINSDFELIRDKTYLFAEALYNAIILQTESPCQLCHDCGGFNTDKVSNKPRANDPAVGEVMKDVVPEELRAIPPQEGVTPTLGYGLPMSPTYPLSPTEEGGVWAPVYQAYYGGVIQTVLGGLQGFISDMGFISGTGSTITYTLPTDPGIIITAPLQAGSCEGMSVLIARICAGIEPLGLYGATDPKEIVEGPELIKRIIYYHLAQMDDRVLAGTQVVSVSTYYQLMSDKLTLPSTHDDSWRKNPFILHLVNEGAECSEGYLPTGHAMLPTRLGERVGDQVDLFVIDPNYNVEKKVVLDLAAEEWRFEAGPYDPPWRGKNMVFVPLNTYPEYPEDLSLTGLEDEASLVYNGGFNWWMGGFNWWMGGFNWWMGEDADCEGGAGCQVGCVPGPGGGLDLVESDDFQLLRTMQGWDIFPHLYHIRNFDGYTFHLQGSEYNDGHAAQTIFHNEGMIAFHSRVQDEAATDIVKVDADHRRVAWRTTESDKRVPSIANFRYVQGASRMGAINGLSLTPSETFTTGWSASHNLWTFDNAGVSKTIELGLAQTGPESLGTFRATVPLSVVGLGVTGHYTTSAWDWGRLDDTLIFLYRDEDGDDAIDNADDYSRILQDIVRPTSIHFGTPHHERGGVHHIAPDTPIYFNVLEASCGISVTHFAIDGGAWQRYEGPFTMRDLIPAATLRVPHKIAFRSINAIGDVEPTNEVWVTLHEELPTLSLGAACGGTYTAPVTVTLTAYSATFEIERVAYQLNGGKVQIADGSPITVSSLGMNEIRAWAYDIAGFRSPITTCYVAIEATPTTYVIPFDQVDPVAQQAMDSWAFKNAMAEPGRLRRAYPTQMCGGVQVERGDYLVTLNGGDDSALADFEHTALPSCTLSDTRALEPLAIAMFCSSAKDNKGDGLSWECGDFLTLFRTHLWGDYVEVLNEADIVAGDLRHYDLLLMPAFTSGYLNHITHTLGITGLTQLQQFVQRGGWLYAQGESIYLVQAAGLAAGAAAEEARAAEQYEAFRVASTHSPLVLGLPPTGTLYTTSGDPILTATQTYTAPIMYTDPVSETPAVLWGEVGRGRVILARGHASAHTEDYPLILNAVLAPMSRRATLLGNARQVYSVNKPPDLVPAWEPGVPISITLPFEPLDFPLYDVVVTATVPANFHVKTEELSGTRVLTEHTQTLLVWTLGTVTSPVALEYRVYTFEDSMADKHDIVVGDAVAAYRSKPGEEVMIVHSPAMVVQSAMAADIYAVKNVEPEELFELPQEGKDVFVTLGVGEHGGDPAHNLTIQEIVPYFTPLLGFVDQTTLPTFMDHTIWLKTTIFFDPSYPLPEGVRSHNTRLSYLQWDGTTYYTFTFPFSATMTHPYDALYDCGNCCDSPFSDGASRLVPTNPLANYVKFKRLPNGDVVVTVPAVKLVWKLGSFQARSVDYDIVRYGMRLQDTLERGVVFDPLPVNTRLHPSMQRPGPQVIENARAASAYVALGRSAIPHLMYIDHDATLVTPVPSEMAQVSHTDLWGREYTTDTRSLLVNLLPRYQGRPGLDYNDLWLQGVNTTYEILIDRDGDGMQDDFTLQYPTHLSATLKVYIRRRAFTHTFGASVFVASIPRGLGYEITPIGSTWADAVEFATPGATVLTAALKIPGYVLLFFQPQRPKSPPIGEVELITVTARLAPRPAGPIEGLIETYDGTQIVFQEEIDHANVFNVLQFPPYGAFGKTNNVNLRKEVLPIRVGRDHGQTLFHTFEIWDPDEPRRFDGNPRQVSHGWKDLVLDVGVGGQWEGELVDSTLSPGDWTFIRVLVGNSMGYSLTNVVVTATTLPKGMHLEPALDLYEDPPVFMDKTFFHLRDIPDAWQGVYYFRLHLDSNSSLTPGQVYTIPFSLEADQVSAGAYPMPEALIGVVEAPGDPVYTTFGYATELQVQDLVSGFVYPRDARLVTAEQLDTLRLRVAQDLISGTRSALYYYMALTQTLPVWVAPAAGEKEVTLDLQQAVPSLPLEDQNRFYVVMRSQLTALNPGGVRVANPFAKVVYKDAFYQPCFAEVGARTIEAHGPLLTIESTLRLIRQFNGLPYEVIIPDEAFDVKETLTVRNDGDYIAVKPVITLVLPISWTEVTAEPQPITRVVQTATQSLNLVFQVPDLLPNAAFEIILRWPDPNGTGGFPRTASRSDENVWASISDTIVLRTGVTDVYTNPYVNRVITDTDMTPLTVTWQTNTPNTPQNLRASVSGCTIHLEWDAVADEVDYWVYGRDAGTSGAFTRLIRVPTSTYRFRGSARHAYEFAVTAVTALGEESHSSNYVTAETRASCTCHIYMPLILRNYRDTGFLPRSGHDSNRSLQP